VAHARAVPCWEILVILWMDLYVCPRRRSLGFFRFQFGCTILSWDLCVVGHMLHLSVPLSPTQIFRGLRSQLNIGCPHGPWSNTQTNLYLFLSPITFFDKGNILISKDINYTQPLQQRNTLMTVRMHTAKKDKRKTQRVIQYESLLAIMQGLLRETLSPKQHNH
jgi:hypothetical protein